MRGVLGGREHCQGFCCGSWTYRHSSWPLGRFAPLCTALRVRMNRFTDFDTWQNNSASRLSAICAIANRPDVPYRAPVVADNLSPGSTTSVRDFRLCVIAVVEQSSKGPLEWY